MVTCKHCGGDSMVKETRDYDLAPIITKLRIRQCKKCRWRWKTIEIEYKDSSNACV